ncbi:MAG: DUF1217 domain-containing protein [Parvularculaceae bacterium]|nr:DUF1217 domain-containing protein [Parvularculaceae bacterium]
MFVPLVPFGGFAGWKVFERTAARQFATFEKSSELQRELAYFREKIGAVTSADALVADRRLLTVALGAFGLETEISKKAIIRRVLEQPSADPQSFANRLNDPRWRAFARTFGFSAGAPPFSVVQFQRDVAARFAERLFERAVGDSDANIRLALNFRREIKTIAESVSVDRAGWFQILGQQPLRRVVEAAFGLPASFANLDVDRQRAILETKAEQAFGGRSAAVLASPEAVDTTLRRFFLSEASQSAPATGLGVAALSLLTAASGASPAALFGARIGE